MNRRSFLRFAAIAPAVAMAPLDAFGVLHAPEGTQFCDWNDPAFMAYIAKELERTMPKIFNLKPTRPYDYDFSLEPDFKVGHSIR